MSGLLNFLILVGWCFLLIFAVALVASRIRIRRQSRSGDGTGPESDD